MVVESDHPLAGRTRGIGLPIHFSAGDEADGATPGHEPLPRSQPAPLYGEHTRAVLREYGFGDERIDALIVEGAVLAHDTQQAAA
jgi:formyl-CoA transferase